MFRKRPGEDDPQNHGRQKTAKNDLHWSSTVPDVSRVARISFKGWTVSSSWCPLKRLGGHPILRGRNMPSRLEPSGQRRSRLVQDSSCTNRRLVTTSSAYQSTTRLTPWNASGLACRADEPVRPAQLLQVGRTHHIIGKHRHEITVRTQIIGTRHQSRFRDRFAHFREIHILLQHRRS